MDDDSCSIDTEILTKELVISLPILSEHDIERMLNGEESSSDDSAPPPSPLFSSSDESEQPSLQRDQQRVHLLKNPDYGVVLSFLELFRPLMRIADYPLRQLEDNLLSEQENSKSRVDVRWPSLYPHFTPCSQSSADRSAPDAVEENLLG